MAWDGWDLGSQVGGLTSAQVREAAALPEERIEAGERWTLFQACEPWEQIQWPEK